MNRKDFILMSLATGPFAALGIPALASGGGKKKRLPVSAHVWVYKRTINMKNIRNILTFALVMITSFVAASAQAPGKVDLIILDSSGKKVLRKEYEIKIQTFGRENLPVCIDLPRKEGGYLVTTQFTQTGKSEVYKSRRYIRIGKGEDFIFPDISP